jgi:hypothetical protein
VSNFASSKGTIHNFDFFERRISEVLGLQGSNSGRAGNRSTILIVFVEPAQHRRETEHKSSEPTAVIVEAVRQFPFALRAKSCVITPFGHVSASQLPCLLPDRDRRPLICRVDFCEFQRIDPLF